MLTVSGKKSSPLIKLKKSFINNNNSLIEREREVIAIYKKQPKRHKCKNCSSSLNHEKHLFIRKTIKYIECEICTHLNGEYEDTTAFNNALYTSSDYADNYTDNELYLQRLNDIYKPKADFLIKSLESCNEDITKLQCLDFGCGSGYFCEALTLSNIKTVGYDVSQLQIDFGNKIWKRNNLYTKSIQDTKEILASTNHQIVSMVGVLEHLQNPNDFIQTIKQNKNIKYFFISVPLFSLSTFFQLVFEDVYERQLGSGHTHLYTKKSLEHLESTFDLKRISEWYFGTDMVDLYRSSLVKLSHENQTATKSFENHFEHLIDKFQLVIDNNQQSSEVQILFKT